MTKQELTKEFIIQLRFMLKDAEDMALRGSQSSFTQREAVEILDVIKNSIEQITNYLTDESEENE